MICPQCHARAVRVIDSREAPAETATRRRRECESCQHRFTTYERLEAPAVRIVKKDGRREAFDRAKLARGIWRACEKRPISEAQIETLIGQIELAIRSRGETELPVEIVGEAAMDALKAFDEIAYIRFASVYRQFADLGEFQKEVVKTLRHAKPAPTAKTKARPRAQSVIK
jgi:transcriptional repressor NrdR